MLHIGQRLQTGDNSQSADCKNLPYTTCITYIAGITHSNQKQGIITMHILTITRKKKKAVIVALKPSSQKTRNCSPSSSKPPGKETNIVEKSTHRDTVRNSRSPPHSFVEIHTAPSPTIHKKVLENY